jgi:phenylalanine-4-hydroxylase
MDMPFPATVFDADHPGSWIMPQPFLRYTARDHATWQQLAARQMRLLQGRIAPAFLDGIRALGLHHGGIPDFGALNRRLTPRTGWQVVAVPGLVPDRAFFRMLAQRQFPAGWWIRKPEQLDYIEEPDVFHDVFGHVPLLTQPAYADYLAAYGRAGLAADENGLRRLARLYWYTVEFGLAATRAGLRIVGAGIASSAGETVFALESASPDRIAFDLRRVLRTQYRIDDFQPAYFVLPGESAWPALDAALIAAPDVDVLAPGARAPGDVLLHQGDGAHHLAHHLT